MTIASEGGWTAVLAADSPDVTVGLAVTLAGDGSTVVPATTEALGASPSGVVEGIAVTSASARQPVTILRSGRLMPTHAPLVGTGNATDFATLDRSGNIVRNPSFTTKAIGICGKDGSVTLSLALGSVPTTTAGVSAAVTAVALSAGDVLTTAVHATDVTRVTKANQAALDAGMMAQGIALAACPALGMAQFAPPGVTVAASVLGLGTSAAPAWGVVDVNGRVVRKNTLDVADLVAGEINTQGNLFFLPFRPTWSYIDVTKPPFNARSDGSADCSGAFRLAQQYAVIPSAESNLNFSSRRVFVPKGLYMLNKPVHIKNQAQEWFGEGRLTTHVLSTSHIGSSFRIGPDLGNFPVQANAFAGGNAAIFKYEARVQDEHWIVLSEEGAGVSVDGVSAFSIEMIVRIDATTSATGALMLSYGERFSNEGIDGYSEAFGVGYLGDTGYPTHNAPYFTITTTMGINTVWGANNSLPIDSNYHHVQVNWSSGTMRMFVDGVAVTLTGTTSWGGTLVQKSWESVVLGGVYQYFLGTRKFATADFHLASLRISDIARNTSGYAPPNAKYTEDTNTVLLMNFDTLDGVFVVSRARPVKGNTGMADAYYAHRRDNVAVVASMTDCAIRDMAITNLYGIAVDMNTAVNSNISGLTLVAKCGIRADNNSYKSTIDHIYATGSSSASRVGISLVGAANVMAVSNIYLAGFDHGVVVYGAGDIIFTGSFHTTVAKGHLLAILSINVTFLADSELSDEASTLSGRLPDFFVGLIAVDNFYSASLQISQSESTCPSIITQGDGFSGAYRHRYDNAYFYGNSSSSGTFKVLGTPMGTIIADARRNTAVPLLTSGSYANAIILLDPENRIGQFSFAMPDTNRTLTRDEHASWHITATGNTATATRTLFWPPFRAGSRVFTNSTAQIITCQTTGGTSRFNVAAGTTAHFDCAGAELTKIS